MQYTNLGGILTPFPGTNVDSMIVIPTPAGTTEGQHKVYVISASDTDLVIEPLTQLPKVSGQGLYWSNPKIELSYAPYDSVVIDKQSIQLTSRSDSDYCKSSEFLLTDDGTVHFKYSITIDNQAVILKKGNYNQIAFPPGVTPPLRSRVKNPGSYNGNNLFVSIIAKPQEEKDEYQFWIHVDALGWIETTQAWLEAFSTGEIREEYMLFLNLTIE
ncbi:hypothetical protein D3C78_20410 [compost metagenome]